MARLNMAPTKSSLLHLSKQLAFAEEGYDLLEQKRQILIFELMNRLSHARFIETQIGEALQRAFAQLREVMLHIGSEALDRAISGINLAHEITLMHQHLMGLRIPRVTIKPAPLEVQFGIGGTSSSTDLAMRRFLEVLPLLAELTELQNAVSRLARELRKTQRRCNALSKTFIPAHRETISYIVSALEERERESFIILKMIRDLLAKS